MEKKRREALKGDRAMESREQQLSWAQWDKEGGGPCRDQLADALLLSQGNTGTERRLVSQSREKRKFPERVC